MKNVIKKGRLRLFLVWLLWVLLAQFVLMNISAALYAGKLTHLNAPSNSITAKPVSKNIFSKTWRLFTGPRFYRQLSSDTPSFSFTPAHLKTTGGISIEGWFAKTDSTSEGTVILFHGLMGQKQQVLHEAAQFRDFGYDVMMVDSRGHGQSGGRVTTIGYREAEEVKLAYDYIKQRGGKNIFLWGISMGAVQIMKAVSDYHLETAGVILEMPFLSLQSHLEGRARVLGFPGQPFGFLTSFWIGVERGFNGWGFKTTKYGRNINCPVLMQYGGKDQLVLQHETDAIYNAIASPNKKLVLFENAQHEMLRNNDPATWNKEVKNFLSQNATPTF